MARSETMTSSIYTVKDAAEQGRGGKGCCLGDITAMAGLAGGSGDVTHLQAALPSFELRLALREAGRRRESYVVSNRLCSAHIRGKGTQCLVEVKLSERTPCRFPALAQSRATVEQLRSRSASR